MKKLFLIALNLIFGAILIFVQAQGSYEPIGPEGGYIQDMVKDNQENILAGIRFGGIYKTTDFGETWAQIFLGYRNLDVRSLAVNSNNHYFAGTDGGGFYRSTNEGVSWEKVNNILSTLTIQVLLITPGNDIYAGTFNGIYKSTDNGTTFSPASSGITTSLISSLAYSGSYLLAGTYYAGVFRSTNDGAIWEAVNDGLDFNGRIVESIGFTQITDNTFEVIFVSMGDKFFESIGLPISWTEDTSPPRNIKNFIITDIRGVSSILAASNTTGGLISKPTANPNDIWTLEIAPEKPCGSIVNTSQGIMAGYYGIGAAGSTDGLNTFPLRNTDLFASNITAIKRLAQDILVGTETGEVWITHDGGITWENHTYDLPPGYITDISYNGFTGSIHVTTPNGVYRSFINETTWTSNQLFGQSVGVNSQGTTLIGYGSSMYVSNDDFQTHTTVNTGAPGVVNIVFDNDDKAYVSATDQFNIQSIGVLTATPPLYDNWIQLGPGLENKIVTNVSYVDNGTFTSVCTGDIYAGTKDGKLFIYNNGQFNEHSNGISLTNPITSIVSENITGNEFPIIEFAQERLSSYNPEDCISEELQTEDDIAFYKMIQGRLLFNLQGSSQLNSENFYIYYGTKGIGVLRKDLLTGVEDALPGIPTDYLLKQNYPNPFNPSTTIEFSIPEQTFVSLEIFNTLGEKVTTLVSEELSAGSYRFNWNAVNLSSGIYYYKLTAETFTETKKLVLLR